MGNTLLYEMKRGWIGENIYIEYIYIYIHIYMSFTLSLSKPSIQPLPGKAFIFHLPPYQGF